MRNGLVSVIMSTRDPLQERTQNALRHLAGSSVDYELILINRNVGWTTASYVNQGLAACSGEYILFLDDDCFVERETLEMMKHTLDGTPVGVVGALLLYPDGTVQHAGGDFWAERTPDDKVQIRTLHRDQHKLPGAYLARTVDYVTGACMMTRRDVIDEIGGYDPDCDMDWGDVDFCLRARQAGYGVLFEPSARAVHLESATRGKAVGNTEWFWRRWRSYIESSVQEQRREVVPVGGIP